jgi:hypothetical protein
MRVHRRAYTIADAEREASERHSLEQGGGETEDAVLELPLGHPQLDLERCHALVCKHVRVQLPAHGERTDAGRDDEAENCGGRVRRRLDWMREPGLHGTKSSGSSTTEGAVVSAN